MVRPTRVRRLRIRRAAQASVLVVGVMLAGSALSFAWHKDVTLVVGGTPESIRTTSTNVEAIAAVPGRSAVRGLAGGTAAGDRPGGRDDRHGERAAGDAGGRVPSGGRPSRCGGLGGGATRSGIRSGRRFPLPVRRRPTRPASVPRSSRSEPSCRGRCTTSQRTRERSGRSSRPWGSNPTLTTASRHHPAPPSSPARRSVSTAGRSSRVDGTRRSRSRSIPGTRATSRPALPRSCAAGRRGSRSGSCASRW